MQPVLKKKLHFYYQTSIIQSKSSWFSTGILSYIQDIMKYPLHKPVLSSKYVCISTNLANQECLQLIYLPTFGIHKRVISPLAIYICSHTYIYTKLLWSLLPKISWNCKQTGLKIQGTKSNSHLKNNTTVTFSLR